jgi:transcription initiation factor TFIIIB Brf1 subunit/transcription initiation factor TFIIB
MAIGVVMTPREIAERLGVEVNVIRDLIERTPDIRPAAFADSTPIFPLEAIPRFRHELNLLEAKEAQGDE